jgi:SNF2 family DNA or RNA helicase
MSVAIVVGELTADRSRIVLIGQGPGEALAGFAKRLELATPLIRNTEPRGGLQLPATWPAVVQLAAECGAAWRPGPALTAWIRAQLLQRTAPPTELAVATPPGLVPRPYQVEGACLIGANGSALLFDEPGTGKTVTTILGLVERVAAGHVALPVLVVCPAAVIDSWVEHVRVWAPRWRATAWRGTPAQRRRKAGTADVYVCSYETARRDAATTNTRREGSALFLLGAQTVVADEVHKIKGQATSQSQAVRRLAGRARNFVGLSGTPITHHPGDLWPALVCLEPGAWPSRERWVGRYCRTVPGDYAATVLGLNEHAEREFRTTLLGRHRRVAKADVLEQLPPKVYSVRTVELPAQWRKVYDSMESDMLAQLPDGGELSVMGVLAQLTRLSQLASAPADVEETVEVVDEDGLQVEKIRTKVQLKAPSWKVDALLEVMAERPGQPVVTFAPSRQLVVLAGEAAHRAGYRVGYVMGGQTAAERTGYVDAFQRGELDLICVTTGAGGVGLTLTAARTAVFLQRPYSLVEALQSEDRLHRIGAERHESIEIVDIVARKTIDSRVRAILRERAGQLSDLVQDPRIVAELLGGAGVRDLRRAS